MTSQSKSCLPNCSPLKLNTWESNIATRRLKLPACLPVIDTSGQWLCYENKEVSMSNVGTAHLKAELETRTNHVVIAVLAEWPIVRAGSIIAINFTHNCQHETDTVHLDRKYSRLRGVAGIKDLRQNVTIPERIQLLSFLAGKGYIWY